MDYQAARQAMIDGQIRPNKVIDEGILSAFKRVPREAFLPINQRNIAYLDEDIPVSGNRWLIQPSTLGQLLQAASPTARDNALVVAGSAGYCAALLGTIVHSCTVVDTFGQKASQLNGLYGSLAIDTVDIEEGNPLQGYAANAPYSLIVIDGAVEHVPQVLFDQLEASGRLVAITRENLANTGVARYYQKNSGGDNVSQRSLFDAFVPILPEFTIAKDFVF